MPSGYCYLIKCFDDNLHKPILVQYTAKSSDEDISKRLKSSLKDSITCKDICKKWTAKDKKACKKATHCHIIL